MLGITIINDNKVYNKFYLKTLF